ncbi:6-phosphogluconolactonase (cycloisomerase 2 family) [Streptomyces sp. BK208]|uniref:lactonase family protein n=1 Tax=Streptomyces sp. BK208 TaxID=2512150 RepID=UPI00105E2432|nr:lactonase family protein [Streptomyces sp. BK208]TDT39014.1 6-phosphogluconolactonase (cycloisomerase 2 family) [Streptomyces sp. BK208]
MADGDRRRRAYIGSFTAAGGPGILTATVAPDDGALTVVSGTDGLADPSYLALSPDGETLYAVSETAEGAVAAYRVCGDKPEPFGRPVSVEGDGPTHLGLYAGHVLTANYGSGTVTAVPLRADGTLARSASGVLRHTGSGPHAQRQQGPHAHQVRPDPSGRWAVSVDLGTDSVRVCTLADGAPAVHREIALRPGSGPRHLAFHPDGAHAYVVNELSPTVTVCHWDAADGLLKPLTEVPVLPGAPAGDAYPSGIAVSPDGRFVWTATRGEDVLSVFVVEPDGLRLSATVPCGGHWPRDITVSEGFLYAANERSGDVTWFALDPATGIPRRTGSLAAPAASCVVFGPA